MKRGVVILISVLCVVAFAGLVVYGWQHRWGGRMDTTVQPPLVLTMPKLDRTLTLAPEDFDDDVWQTLPALEVPMLHQITKVPHSRDLVPIVTVRTFHNGSDVYFLLEWGDTTHSGVHDIEEFPDSVAVGFPLGGEPPSESIMMGFQSLVNIWQWKANLDALVWGPDPDQRVTANVNYTYLAQADLPSAGEEVTSACQDLVAIRPGTLTAKEEIIVSGRGLWRDGRWQVIIRRALTTADADNDAQFTPGQTHVTFAVWDGGQGDRGSRKSISEWVVLEIESSVRAPAPEPAEADEDSSSPSGPATTAAGGPPLATTTWPMLLADAPGDEAEPVTINISARRFEYTPSEITVQRGQLVTFRLVSEDVTHGLYLDGYGINMKVRAGDVATTTFRADRSGRFTFRCSETCGPFHPYMIGYLNVEPNTRYHVFVIAMAVICALVVVGALVGSLVAHKRKEVA